MGAGAGAAQKYGDQHVNNSAGGTPCHSPPTSDKHDERIFKWPSNKTVPDEENGLLYGALVEEMEIKAKIAREIAGIVNNTSRTGSNSVG